MSPKFKTNVILLYILLLFLSIFYLQKILKSDIASSKIKAFCD
jgi:hypothetical protein